MSAAEMQKLNVCWNNRGVFRGGALEARVLLFLAKSILFFYILYNV